MRQPAFAHLTGDGHVAALRPQPHRWRARRARVMLAPAASDAKDDCADPAPWLAVRGAAAVIPCPPDLCADASGGAGRSAEGLFALAPDGWRPLPTPRTRVLVLDRGGPDFAPAEPPAPVPLPIGIAQDAARPHLAAGPHAAAAARAAPDFTADRHPALPASAAARAGGRLVLVRRGRRRAPASGAAVRRRLAHRGAAGRRRWRSRGLADGAISWPCCCPVRRLGVLRRSGLQVHPTARADRAAVHAGHRRRRTAGRRAAQRAGLRRPRPASSVTGWAIATKRWPGTPSRVRSFDGRALWRRRGRRLCLAPPAGARTLYARDPRRWRRTALSRPSTSTARIFAVRLAPRVHRRVRPGRAHRSCWRRKTTDDLPPCQVVRSRRGAGRTIGGAAVVPAAGDVLAAADLAAAGGARLAAAGRAGRARRDGRRARPAGAHRHAVRGSTGPRIGRPPPTPWPQVTLEGLIKAPPGRYLALRLRLSGTSRTSPAVMAVRATLSSAVAAGQPAGLLAGRPGRPPTPLTGRWRYSKAG